MPSKVERGNPAERKVKRDDDDLDDLLNDFSGPKKGGAEKAQ